MGQKRKQPVYAPSATDIRKHKESWDSPDPGFLADTDGYPAGKCPNGMTIELAQQLLDDGIFVTGRNPRSPFPEDIYNVYEGVPYRAHQKQPGQYHGFPERPSNIPPGIREQLRDRIEMAGDLETYERWLQEADVDGA